MRGRVAPAARHRIGNHAVTMCVLRAEGIEFEPARWRIAARRLRRRGVSRDYRAPYQNAFQRRESLGNSDLRSLGVLSNITSWALADRDAKTSSS